MRRLVVLLALAAATACVGVAFTAGNSVPVSYANVQAFSINANALKPAQCAALTLTAVVRIGVNTPGAAAELVLGRSVADSINAAGGTDCVLGGGGGDTINGGTGVDVCIGGPGTDTFSNCETQIQ